MKKTINSHDFHDAFFAAGRDKQFTHDAREALFEHLKEMEKETGTETELDVVELCCEFAEYASAKDAADEYGFEPTDHDADGETLNEEALEWLRDRTQVIEITGETGVIIQQF